MADHVSEPQVVHFAIGDLRVKKPWATYTLIALMIGVYLCELAFPVQPARSFGSPAALTLLAMGAMNGVFIDKYHQVYRLLTAVFLHGGWLHLAFNMYALFLAGSFLEKAAGRFWLLLFFIIGGACGSLASWVLNPQAGLSVGASGAIMALLSGVYLASHRLPSPAHKNILRKNIIQIFVLSLIPFIPFAGIKIDVAGHIGGILGGGLLGYLMIKLWPAHSRTPKYEGCAGTMAFIGFAMALYGAAQSVMHFHEFIQISTLLNHAKP